ncbi:hypothetical protein KO353_02290 [Elioraea tepida]|jgi:hypothetical protein|uniref:Uncharacterized protein n=1 Tax=Elioraea tepida TaxID=2843330 RepID=A0A975YK49_9PROT|nr:hypothetical protein [Elioraea tepida]QXM25102.1 hypothetical protein KO353_02290 [Elioraea tepida]
MRLWTALLGAWLAAGSGTSGEGGSMRDPVRPSLDPHPLPAAEQGAGDASQRATMTARGARSA